MQQDGIIRIQKPPQNRGGWFDKVRNFLKRFSKWFARAVSKTREVEGTASGSVAKSTLVSPPAKGNAILRIRVRPRQGGSGVAGGNNSANTDGPAESMVTDTGIIVVATDVPKCNACKEELNDGRPKARCSRNRKHVIHSDCVEFMKNKCPYCGGRIGSYSRPAAGD
jgi:hypothetical protein